MTSPSKMAATSDILYNYCFSVICCASATGDDNGGCPIHKITRADHEKKAGFEK